MLLVELSRVESEAEASVKIELAGMNMRTLKGEEALQFVDFHINALTDQIHEGLSKFSKASAFFALLATFRQTDEIINLPGHVISDDLMIELGRVSLENHEEWRRLCASLEADTSPAVAKRLFTTLLQSAAIGESFRRVGLSEAGQLLTCGAGVISYFQTRRRHLVALLYTIPLKSVGKCTVNQLDSMNQFLPCIEPYGSGLTSMFTHRMMLRVFPDYELYEDGIGVSANRFYNPLDGLGLEPERASIVEMANQSTAARPQLEELDHSYVFSASELRNDISSMEAAYVEFGLTDTEFTRLAGLVRQVSFFVRDNYFIELDVPTFDRLCESFGLSSLEKNGLVTSGVGYADSLEGFWPFIQIDDTVVSTVTLLSRFLYNTKSQALERSKRFKIRAGFIFEETVRSTLTEFGFQVSNTRRINRQEFDVIAIRSGTIYNLQCKNNAVDLSSISNSPRGFARYNRYLDRYYKKALAKEVARDGLLAKEFGLSRIEHFVISRYAIATDNPRVIPYCRIGDFGEIFGALGAAR